MVLRVLQRGNVAVRQDGLLDSHLTRSLLASVSWVTSRLTILTYYFSPYCKQQHLKSKALIWRNWKLNRDSGALRLKSLV